MTEDQIRREKLIVSDLEKLVSKQSIRDFLESHYPIKGTMISKHISWVCGISVGGRFTEGSGSIGYSCWLSS